MLKHLILKRHCWQTLRKWEKNRITTFRWRNGRAWEIASQKEKLSVQNCRASGIHGIHKKVIERNWQNEIIMYMHRYILSVMPTQFNSQQCVRMRVYGEAEGWWFLFDFRRFHFYFNFSMFCALCVFFLLSDTPATDITVSQWNGYVWVCIHNNKCMQKKKCYSQTERKKK